MTPLHFRDCGKGVNKDLLPSELAPGVWSDALNVEFDGVFGRRRSGIEAVYTTPTATPYYIQTFNTLTARFLVQAGAATVFVDDGTTRTDISPASAPTGSRDDRWTGGDFQGVLILNNGVDKPWYWGGNVANDLATLTNWPVNDIAGVLRPFREYLVAASITRSGTTYPQLVMWSNAAEPGAIPTSWTAAVTNDSGDDPMTGKGAVIDMLPLGSVNILYCRSGRVAMRYIGGNEVFAFDALPGDDGLLNKGCVVEVPSGHVFFTGDDVMIHSGGEARSIAEDRIRDWIASTIDSTNADRAFITKNAQKNEVWICFPSAGSEDCNYAAVWNWIGDTWSIYSLPNLTYATSGLPSTALNAGTWAAAIGTWDEQSARWNENQFSYNSPRLMVSTAAPLIGMVGVGTTDFGEPIEAYRERVGIRPSDEDRTYFIRASRWAFSGPSGATISIHHGASMTADGEPSYATAATHTQGTTNWTNRMSTRGRYLAVKLVDTDGPILGARSFELDIRGGGRF